MDAIPFGRFFKTSWADGTAAIVNRPVISLIVFALTFSSILWTNTLSEMARSAKLTGAHLDGTYFLRSFGGMLFLFLGVVMLSVQVIRYAIFGEGAPAQITYLRGVWRNWCLGWFFSIAWLVIGVATFFVSFYGFRQMGLLHSSVLLGLAVNILLVIAFLAVVVFTQVRLEILFCSRALGEPLSLSGAWQLTKGRFWTMFVLHLLVSLPLFGLQLLHFFAYRLLHVSLSQGNLLLESAAVGAVMMMLGTAVWSACLALLYRAFVANASVAAQDMVY